MSGFVKPEEFAIREFQVCQETPALLGNRRRKFYASGFERLDCALEIATHQIKLGRTAVFRWMDGNFRGRRGKDQPAVACIHRRELKDILKEAPNGLGIFAVENRVHPSDHVCPPFLRQDGIYNGSYCCNVNT